MTRRTSVPGLAVAIVGFMLVLAAPSAHAQARPQCPVIDARVTAAPAYEPQFVGTFKYTLTVTWDVGRRDPSHLDILLGLANCLCICDSRIMRFAPIAGTSSGIDGAGGACVVPYTGAYVCKGDPSIRNDLAGPAVKFVPDETLCSTNETGTGTFVFYSPFPPGPYEIQQDAIAIKHGNETCYGSIAGVLPGCDCSVPAPVATWGQLKFVYR